VEYVIGMSRAIGDDAARRFAQGFYRGLWTGNGFNYAGAFQNGLVAIKMRGIAEAHTPVFLDRAEVFDPRRRYQAEVRKYALHGKIGEFDKRKLALLARNLPLDLPEADCLQAEIVAEIQAHLAEYGGLLKAALDEAYPLAQEYLDDLRQAQADLKLSDEQVRRLREQAEAPYKAKAEVGAREKAEMERKAKAERAAKEKAEAERKAQEQAERDARAEAKTEKDAREKAERKAKEEQAAREKAEAEKKAKEKIPPSPPLPKRGKDEAETEIAVSEKSPPLPKEGRFKNR
jgi:hypothetical protein